MDIPSFTSAWPGLQNQSETWSEEATIQYSPVPGMVLTLVDTNKCLFMMMSYKGATIRYELPRLPLELWMFSK